MNNNLDVKADAFNQFSPRLYTYSFPVRLARYGVHESLGRFEASNYLFFSFP